MLENCCSFPSVHLFMSISIGLCEESYFIAAIFHAVLAVENYFVRLEKNVETKINVIVKRVLSEATSNPQNRANINSVYWARTQPTSESPKWIVSFFTLAELEICKLKLTSVSRLAITWIDSICILFKWRFKRKFTESNDVDQT